VRSLAQNFAKSLGFTGVDFTYFKYLQLCAEPLPTSGSNLSTKQNDGATVSKQRQFFGVLTF
jgi:hypothetical protein